MMIDVTRCLALIVGLFIGLAAFVPLSAAPKGKPAAKGAQGQTPNRKGAPDAAGDEEQLPVDELNAPDVGIPELEADADEAAAPPEQDPDETPEGRQRIAELEAHARQKISEIDTIRKGVNKPYREYLGRIAADQKRYQKIAVARNNLADLEAQYAALSDQLSITAAPNLRSNLTSAMKKLESQASGHRQTMEKAASDIQDNAPEIQALMIRLKPEFDRIHQHANEMSEARLQWVQLRKPFEKYVRGDYTKLRAVLDSWLLIDGGWFYAYVWGALCAAELDDVDAADLYVQRALRLFNQEYNRQMNKPEAAMLNAIRGLVSLQIQPKQNALARKALEDSSRLALAMKDKDAGTAYMTFFIIGRAYASRGTESGRALTNLNKSLSLRPRFLCAQLWQARIQTTATNQNSRNLPDGIKTLEKIWTDTHQQSWRAASFLADAYLMDKQADKAATMKQTALELAPSEVHDRINDSFAATEKLAATPVKQ